MAKSLPHRVVRVAVWVYYVCASLWMLAVLTGLVGTRHLTDVVVALWIQAVVLWYVVDDIKKGKIKLGRKIKE